MVGVVAARASASALRRAARPPDASARAATAGRARGSDVREMTRCAARRSARVRPSTKATIGAEHVGGRREIALVHAQLAAAKLTMTLRFRVRRQRVMRVRPSRAAARAARRGIRAARARRRSRARAAPRAWRPPKQPSSAREAFGRARRRSRCCVGRPDEGRHLDVGARDADAVHGRRTTAARAIGDRARTSR